MTSLYRPHRMITWRSGSVMLLSVIILSVILLKMIVTSSFALGQKLQGDITLQNKKIAEATATACMEHAINFFGRDATYVGNEVYPVGSLSCTIYPITSGVTGWTIKTVATVGVQTFRLQVTLSSRVPPIITSWQEVSAFY